MSDLLISEDVWWLDSKMTPYTNNINKPVEMSYIEF